jgi:hypothetical protein
MPSILTDGGPAIARPDSLRHNGACLRGMRLSPRDEDVMSFLAELFAFMRERKKYWLVPVVIMMVIFSGLVLLTKGSVVAPFIYTIF